MQYYILIGLIAVMIYIEIFKYGAKSNIHNIVQNVCDNEDIRLLFSKAEVTGTQFMQMLLNQCKSKHVLIIESYGDIGAITTTI